MTPLRKISGFLPYLLVVFLNAFVDLGHKIVIQNTIFKHWDGESQVILTALINALILLPFILLFSPAGYLADKYAKPRVMRWSALFAVLATSLITACYFMGWFWAAFALTLALSIQSALYSPAKYGYIRELSGDENLARANGAVQAVTIVAILAGTFVFSFFFEQFYEVASLSPEETLRLIAPLGFALVALSIVEWLMTGALPDRMVADSAVKTRAFDVRAYRRGNYLRSNWDTIRSSRPVWLSIVGLSMFWGVSQVVVSAFPAHAKLVLGETNTVVIQGLLAITGLGIVLGSLLAGRTSRAHLELGWIPIAALGIAGCLLLLPMTHQVEIIALLFLILGICGGLFIVPLNALIQYSAKENQLGTVLAGNNWVQNITMLLFLVITVLFATLGLSGKPLFYGLAMVAVFGTLYTVMQLPHSLARIIAGLILKRRYKVAVSGFDHLPKQGGVLLLGNHISWIDWALVQIACPRPVRFVMLRSIYDTWYLKPVLKAFGAIPISPGNSTRSLDAVRKCLNNGEVVCLFPEGAISRNGQLGMFKKGYERALVGLESSNVAIVPFYLRGLWGSKLSRSNSEKMRENTLAVNSGAGLKRTVIVAFGKPLPLTTKADQLKQKVFELSIDAWAEYTQQLESLPMMWLQQAKRRLTAVSVMESSGAVYRHGQMIAATALLTRHIKRHAQQQNVAVLLPTSGAGIMANLAVMWSGKTAVNLNFSTGADVVRKAMAQADIKTVYSSTRFLKKLASKGIDIDAMLAGAQVQMMEDVLTAPSRLAWCAAFASSVLPSSWLYRLWGKSSALEAPAQILFSSGSEGTPKGIVLSHRNLVANIKQTTDVLNLQQDDVMMASLPLFHSFGLTVNALLPMLEGVRVVCHPDPTDALGVAKAIARAKATILCGTATFLRLYTRNRKVQPLMLDSLRVVVAGAEKLNEDVREAFELKFKKVIYEGYGATETTPVASVNIPDALDISAWQVQSGQKVGTVGMPLPGSCFRIVDPESLAVLPTGEDGLILMAGGQVMLGYLNDDTKTNDVIIELDGRRWYKTGDKGRLDNDGFLTIVDRYSRFAKIGGEMISLSAVEDQVRKCLPEEYGEIEIAAVNLPDSKKGECIVLLATVATDQNIRAQLKSTMVAAQINPLFIPAEICVVDDLPKLGSGKLDYKSMKDIAAQK